jgi:hypothetical protein
MPYSWLQDNALNIRGHLLIAGAMLIHGLPLRAPADLAKVCRTLGISSFTPTEAIAYRRDLGDGIVSPIIWPDDRLLCPLQEGCWNTTFPAVVLTACVTPPESGGQAHLSDTRLVAARLPIDLGNRVRADGWIMKRVFHDGFGMSWMDAFSVADRPDLYRVLASEGIEYRWLPDGALRTWRRRPGVIDHPVTGQECWFNQVAFVNAASMEPRERAILTQAFGLDLPLDSAFGDGTPISEADLAAIHRGYDSTVHGLTWGRGDLLITDNVIMAQGRAGFEGAAEFLVALGASSGRTRRVVSNA